METDRLFRELKDHFDALETDNKRVKGERDVFLMTLKDIVSIWENAEGTFEEDGERMKALAEEAISEWEI